MDKNIASKIDEYAFDDYKETVWVYLKSSNSKGANFDPYLDVGYTETTESPYPIKCLVRQIASNSLIMREIGLVEAGAIELIVKKNDIGFFKACKKIKYDDEFYSPYIKALGNTVQIYKRPFGYYRVVLTRTGN